MATSEYIPEKGSRSRRPSLVSPFPLGKPHGFINASVLAPLPMVLSDLFAILLAGVFSLVLRAVLVDNVVDITRLPVSIGKEPLGLLYLSWFMVVYTFIARRYGLYGQMINSATGSHELRMTVQACLNAGMLLCGAVYMTHNLSISRVLVLIFTLAAMLMLCIRRAIWRLRRYRLYERGLSTRHVLILGTSHLSFALGRQIVSQPRLGYTLCGYILSPGSSQAPPIPGANILGNLADIQRIVRRHFIDEIVITESCPTEQVITLLKEARELGLDIRAVSGYYNDLAMNAGIEYLGVFPLVSLHRDTQRTISLAFKRTGDFVFSLLALIVAAPVMAAIAIAIRLESEGPIFYVSERIGRRGHVFPCFKFRTMVKNADQLRHHLDSLNERDGVLFKLTNDPRITRVGRTLRKYSLDELPQFFNVLRGEMSLVGPRPPLASEVENYKLEHLRRLEVLPGLTGLWQVQARQDSSFEKYIALDTAYVENWSFWLDLKILVQTAEVVLRGTGV
ncbi:MAG TPA: sugar transferase [Acidobacteriaceae bacterium]|nr:sugar transferase [Acidobacteriaceae bacterium]